VAILFRRYTSVITASSQNSSSSSAFLNINLIDFLVIWIARSATPFWLDLYVTVYYNSIPYNLYYLSRICFSSGVLLFYITYSFCPVYNWTEATYLSNLIIVLFLIFIGIVHVFLFKLSIISRNITLLVNNFGNSPAISINTSSRNLFFYNNSFFLIEFLILVLAHTSQIYLSLDTLISLARVVILCRVLIFAGPR
jgi:hypothetical protein